MEIKEAVKSSDPRAGVTGLQLKAAGIRIPPTVAHIPSRRVFLRGG